MISYPFIRIGCCCPSCKTPIEEIKNYCKRLYQDRQFIENSLRYSFSNGLLEGQVNRLKTIKRMMYGRAGVALLRIRMLFQFT
ncbi:transposase [Peribacillus asahii]|uniref:transposase n=1 Tax=Peribacillus asahii TaxID=228899 RepID=UPI00207AA2AE|nr:transposase [Peribacillus asahii]USK87285.1 transposase [Peribacillus asahii]